MFSPSNGTTFLAPFVNNHKLHPPATGIMIISMMATPIWQNQLWTKLVKDKPTLDQQESIYEGAGATVSWWSSWFVRYIRGVCLSVCVTIALIK